MISTALDENRDARHHQRGGRSRRTLILLVASMLVLGFSAVPASAGVSCHKVNAKGVGQFAPPEAGDPANLLRTVVQIQGGGLLQGTTRSELFNTFVPPTTILMDGAITFTTNRATLTVAVSGWFDLATEEFRVSGPVTDSTGKLAGASGHLTLQGAQAGLDDPNWAFNETVTGEICVDLSTSE